jgi:outer membrane protein assembly factor BamE (lipoprotein component of BamABCDE complex)
MARPIALLGLALICAACTPIENQRGYLPDPQVVQSISVGKDTKTSVSDRLGNPSTSATFDNDVWYYISSREEQMAFFSPVVQSRDVLAIEFDKQGQVAAVRHYSLKDGRVIAFATRETPTKGRELTLIQQLFNAVPGAALPEEKKGGDQGGGGS